MQYFKAFDFVENKLCLSIRMKKYLSTYIEN